MVEMTSIRVRMFVDTPFLVIVSVPVTGSYLTVVPVTAPPVAPNPDKKSVNDCVFVYSEHCFQQEQNY